MNDSRYTSFLASYMDSYLKESRLWNLQRNNISEDANRRNRETLEILENEYDLDYEIQERVQMGKGVKIAKNIYLNQDHEFRWPSLLEKADEGKGFCHALRTHAAILVDGSVVPCCLDGDVYWKIMER